ncbi:MAG: insulinase family protein, partial [Oscillospiraceae bacterium]|nr:insulinase family protein [Oscillospiraceae bacterium]
NQSKMVLVFKSENEDKYAMKFLSALYGETPFSKLFENVREKMSLCYYCASGYTLTKNTIIVDCGVENKNIEIAEKEILNQLDEIKKGNFSDEDMNNVLLSFANSLNAIGDTIGSYINWYNSAFIGKELLNPEETLERYKSVTKERIIKSAESLTLDTVYVMKSKESF